MEERTYHYDAFISYRHLAGGIKIANYLQKLLETYRSPCDGTHVKKGGRIRRIFTNKSEMPLSTDIGATIKDALEQSRMLIVLATPEYRKSKWCIHHI